MTAQQYISSVLAACIAPTHHGQGHHNLTGEYALVEARGITKGAQIQQRVHHPDGTITWGPFLVFPETPPALATQVLALGGHGVAHMEGLRWVVYNQSSRPELNNSSETLRVLAADGRVLAERVFAANSCDVLPPTPQPVVTTPTVPAAPPYSPLRRK